MITDSILKWMVILFVLCIGGTQAYKARYTITIDLIAPESAKVAWKSPSTIELEIDGLGRPQKKVFNLKTRSNNLFEYSHGDTPCPNCFFRLTFKDQDPKSAAVFYASIEYKHIAGKTYEDFIDVFLTLNEDISSFNYGVNKYLKSSENPEVTIINEIPMLDALDTPPIFEDFTASAIAIDPTGAKKPEEQPPEEQSFFKKYFWYIVIGGFILFQLLSVDKDKLQQAMNPAQ